MNEDNDDAEEYELLLQLNLLLLQLAVVAVGAVFCFPDERAASFFEQRLAWNEYCNRHTERGTFRIRMRMERPSFDKLLHLVHDDLLVSETFAVRRGGAIVPELCLYCTLRYLAGGSYLDICDIAGISKASFYRVIWKTITAIVKCPELKITFPSSRSEIKDAISGFASMLASALVAQFTTVLA
jgi:hypothetical protein